MLAATILNAPLAASIAATILNAVLSYVSDAIGGNIQYSRNVFHVSRTVHMKLWGLYSINLVSCLKLHFNVFHLTRKENQRKGQKKTCVFTNQSTCIPFIVFYIAITIRWRFFHVLVIKGQNYINELQK